MDRSTANTNVPVTPRDDGDDEQVDMYRNPLKFLICKKKFPDVLRILKFVYPECFWAWTEENSENVTVFAEENTTRPLSLVETCMRFFEKCRETRERYPNLIPQFNFDTKSECLECKCPVGYPVANCSIVHEVETQAPIAVRLQKCGKSIDSLKPAKNRIASNVVRLECFDSVSETKLNPTESGKARAVPERLATPVKAAENYWTNLETQNGASLEEIWNTGSTSRHVSSETPAVLTRAEFDKEIRFLLKFTNPNLRVNSIDSLVDSEAAVEPCVLLNSGTKTTEESSDTDGENFNESSLNEFLQIKVAALKDVPEHEASNINALTQLSLIVKKEMTRGGPLFLTCTATDTLHLQLVMALLRCGVEPTPMKFKKLFDQNDELGSFGHHRVNEASNKRKLRSIEAPFVQLLMRYECYKWISENLDLSLTAEEIKNSTVLNEFYLTKTTFSSSIWIDEHIRENLVRSAYDLNGHVMKCSLEDYSRFRSEAFQVVCYMMTMSNVPIAQDLMVLDIVLGCGDIELAEALSRAGKLSVNLTEQMNKFLDLYQRVDQNKKTRMENILRRSNLQARHSEYVWRCIFMGHVQLAKILLIKGLNDEFECAVSADKPFKQTFRGPKPVFIMPLLQSSYWKDHVKKWTVVENKNDSVTYPPNLLDAVSSIEHVLDAVVRPLAELPVRCTRSAFPVIMNIATLSQFGYLEEDLREMSGDLVYHVFGNRGSLQSLCMRRIFKSLVSAKTLVYRRTHGYALRFVGPIVFPVGIRSGMIVNGEAITATEPVISCQSCFELRRLCATCRNLEWHLNMAMTRSVCDILCIPRKFSKLMAMECVRYEVVARISCSLLRTKQGSYNPYDFRAVNHGRGLSTPSLRRNDEGEDVDSDTSSEINISSFLASNSSADESTSRFSISSITGRYRL